MRLVPRIGGITRYTSLGSSLGVPGRDVRLLAGAVSGPDGGPLSGSGYHILITPEPPAGFVRQPPRIAGRVELLADDARATKLTVASVLHPAGVTRTKALGSERMARELRDAPPGGEGALRAAVWEFMRPMLSPAPVALNRDTFVVNESPETTVDLDGHRAASDLDELGLNDEPDTEAT